MSSRATGEAVGALLVALQFALLGVLAWLALRGLRAAAPTPDAVALVAAGALLGLWALSANRPGNFNVRPTPRADGALVEHGPYRWIRHPMYTSLLLGGLGAARLADGTAAWLVFAALAVVLAVKAGVEERALRRHHPAYEAYRERTWRFVPGVY